MANTTAGNVIKKRPHTYTPKELAAISDGIADTLDASDALDREKQIFNQGIKQREKELNDTLQTLRSNKKQGFEIREYECAVIREIATKTVNYVDVKSGEVISQEPFTKDDWDIVMGQSQLGMFNVDAPDENEIRGRVLHPNYDDEGNPIAGPDTDRYNDTYPSSPYKHLSAPKDVDFAPALPSTDVADFIASVDDESQKFYHDVLAAIKDYDVEQLREALPHYQAETVDGKEVDETAKKVRAILASYIQQRIGILEGIASEQSAGPETDLYNEALTVAQEDDETITARLDAMSQEEIKAKLAQYDQYDQDEHSAVSFYAAALRGAILPSDAEQNHAADDGPEAQDDDDQDDESEPQGEGDEPEPEKPKRTPKRPANRKK